MHICEALHRRTLALLFLQFYQVQSAVISYRHSFIKKNDSTNVLDFATTKKKLHKTNNALAITSVTCCVWLLHFGGQDQIQSSVENLGVLTCHCLSLLYWWVLSFLMHRSSNFQIQFFLWIKGHVAIWCCEYFSWNRWKSKHMRFLSRRENDIRRGLKATMLSCPNLRRT